MATQPTAPLELRPMSVAELLDRTFSLYRNFFWLWIGIAVMPQVILFAVRLLGYNMQSSGEVAGALAGAFVLLLGGLAFWLLNMIAQGGVVNAVSQIYLGRPTTVRASYDVAFGRIGAVIALALISAIAIGVGLVLCIIPGVIMAIFFALSLPVLLVERADIGGAIERSFSLGKEAWPPILLVYVLFWVLSFGLSAVAVMPFTILAEVNRTHSMVWTSLQAASQFVSGTLVSPLLNIALTLVYFDQRIRREGFDLQVLIAGLDAQPLPPTPPAAPAPPPAL